MPFDVVGVLNLGVIGLGFLLAFLSYRLLSAAATRREPTDPKPIYVFMAFSLLVILAGMTSEYVRNSFELRLRELEKQNASLSDQVRELKSRPTFPNRQVLAGLSTEAGELSKDVEMCRREAYGATTNTSDRDGCLAAAANAMNAGQRALTSVQDIKGKLDALLSQDHE